MKRSLCCSGFWDSCISKELFDFGFDLAWESTVGTPSPMMLGASDMLEGAGKQITKTFFGKRNRISSFNWNQLNVNLAGRATDGITGYWNRTQDALLDINHPNGLNDFIRNGRNNCWQCTELGAQRLGYGRALDDVAWNTKGLPSDMAEVYLRTQGKVTVR